jgi:hypothetical protein
MEKPSWWTGCVSLVAGLTLTACTHGQQGQVAKAVEEPAAKEAVNETRGRCPTDLNQTQVALSEEAETVRVIFVTSDPSQKEELHRRVIEVGNALDDVHPSVNAAGQLIEHLPTPTPQVREKAVGNASPSQSGYELVISSPNPEVHQRVRADLDEEVRQWRKGECPILRDAPLTSRPPAPPTMTPANARLSPGQDR